MIGAHAGAVLRCPVGAFDVGEEHEILDRLGELRDAGAGYFIFNMPTSGVDKVRRVGELAAKL